MVLQGRQSREHFYMKKLVVNTKPIPDALNTNAATFYTTYEAYVEMEIMFYTNHGWLICKECSYKVLTVEQYKEHIHLNHNVSKRLFHCYDEIDHRKGETFNCFQCDAVFTSARDLTRHALREHHHVSYNCKLCPKTFTYRDNLLRHKKIVHEGAGVTCIKCEKNFSRIDSLVEHYENIHENIEPLVCEDCDSNFSNLRNLQRHKYFRHDENGTPKFRCTQCGEVCCTGKLLKAHEIKNHPVSFNCNVCGSDFSCKSALDRHMKRRQHFSCDKCNVKYQ